MRLSVIFKAISAILFVVVVMLGMTLATTDFNGYKSEISDVVKTLTDRRLVIGGKFKLAFGLTPAVTVNRVTFSNAKWGSRPDMVRIKRLRAELQLLPLLIGDIRIRRVVLSGADILLETRADGVGNWALQPSAKGQQTVPVNLTFDRVLIEDSVLVWRDRRTGTRRQVKIDRLRTRATAADAPLNLDLIGSYNGEPVRLDGHIDSLARLTSNKPTTIKLDLKAGGARLRAQGRMRNPMTGAGVKMSVSVAGRNIATLSRLVGSTLPSIGPYDLTAEVSDRRSRWRLNDVKLKVGKSDFSGDVYIDPNTDPVRVFANLQSKQVRVEDLQEGKARARRVRVRKKSRKASGRATRAQQAERLFSAEPLSIAGLKDISAKLSLKANLVRVGDFAFESASLTAVVRDGRVIVRPATAKFAGGDLSLHFNLSSAKERVRLELSADLRKMDLARLVKYLGYRGLATGRVNAGTSLTGSGRSIRTIMAGLNGRLHATMKGGRIDNRMFSRLSGETVSAILPWSSDTKGISVKCLVGQYNIRKGKLASNVTLLDMDRLLVEGEGGVDFESEKIDFRIIPRAKEASLVNLLVPIDIDGMLAEPDVSPDPAGVARSALGFATGGILGHGLVSEVISSIVSSLTGEDEDGPCLKALTKVSRPNASSGK